MSTVLKRVTIQQLKKELGSIGLNFFSGYIAEAYTQKLQWPQAYRIYNEMRRRDPTIRSLLNAIRLMANDVEWKVEPWDDTPRARQLAEFVESNLWHMQTSIDDVLDDALTALSFGWSWFEQVYKRTKDGRIGWNKIAFRRQSTWYQWELDEHGELVGLWQAAPPNYDPVFLPRDKSFHFVPERDGGNPEGISILEGAYEPWYFIKNLQIVNGIGWQRTFVGLPVFEMDDGVTDDEIRDIDAMGRGLVVNEHQYVRVPNTVKFRLDTVANTSAGTLLDNIREYRRLILSIVLADFIMLGSSQTGSWALGRDKSTLFLMAVNGWLDRFATQFTKQCIQPLLRYNGWNEEEIPWLSHSQIIKPNMQELGQFVSQVADYINWGEDDIIWLRQQAGLPEVSGPKADTSVTAAEFAEGDPGADKLRRELEKLVARVTAGYFRRLLRRLRELLESGLHPDDAFWKKARETFRSMFLSTTGNVIRDVIDHAVRETYATIGMGVDWTLVNTEALKWAQQYTIKLSDMIISHTEDATRQAIVNWIETGDPLPKLIQALEPIYGPQRAELIASTEVTRIYAEANKKLWKELGVVSEMQWNTAMDEHVCPICEPLNGKSVKLEGGKWKVKVGGKMIEVDQPPAHPRCRCWLSPVIKR